ncbi:PilZ domain-containing protein [Candidatus Moduliflexota bacterium]
MKKICLIRDDRTYWSTIEKYLCAVNAEVSTSGGNDEPEGLIDSKPDLIIANAKAHHGMARRIRQIPTIVIKEGTPPVALVRTTAERNIMITGWPLERYQLLDITSKMLAVAPRRLFRTLIRIFTKGDEFGSLAQSRDFSLSGMAFKSEKHLSKGEKIKISFSLPDVNRSMRLDAEVMRGNGKDDGKDSLYGARFVNLDKDNHHLLSSFVLCS